MWMNRRFPALPIGPDRRALGAEQVRQGEDAGRGCPQRDQPCTPRERTRTAGTGAVPETAPAPPSCEGWDGYARCWAR